MKRPLDREQPAPDPKVSLGAVAGGVAPVAEYPSGDRYAISATGTLRRIHADGSLAARLTKAQKKAAKRWRHVMRRYA